MNRRRELNGVYWALTAHERAELLIGALYEGEPADPRVTRFMPLAQAGELADYTALAGAVHLMVPVAERFLSDCRVTMMAVLLADATAPTEAERVERLKQSIPAIRARRGELYAWVRFAREVVSDFDDSELILPEYLLGLIGEAQATLTKLTDMFARELPPAKLKTPLDARCLAELHELLEGYQLLVR